MTFVPPKVNQNIWATHVPGRSPVFKVHSSEGLANSAIGYHFPGVTVTKYKLVDGEWAVHQVFEKPESCDWCGGTFIIHQYGRDYTYARRPYNPRTTHAKFNLPVICESCYQKDYKAQRAEIEKQRELAKLAELKAKYGD